MATSVSRRKYLAIARTILGRALTSQGLVQEATAELRSAVASADALGSPLFRWRSRAALATAARRANETDTETALLEAQGIIRDVAASLSPERGAVYLAAPEVVEVLEAAW
jgi:hypothetical protein